MQVNRGLVFWGVALITAGLVALAIQSDLIAAESARQAWRLWPAVLIVIGLGVIASRTPFGAAASLIAGVVVGGLAGTVVAGAPDGLTIGCGGEPTETVTDNGAFTADAEVIVDLNCGELVVSTAAGSEWRIDARHGRGEEPEITADGSSLALRAEGGGFIGFSGGRQEWDLTLPTDISLDLSVDANAGSSRIDLADAQLSRLAIDANAGSVRLALPGAEVGEFVIDANAGSVSIDTDASTRLAGSVEMNAGSLELCVPDGVAVAITLEDEGPTFSHNLDASGLERNGDTWSSGAGSPDLRLSVDANAASFTFNPESGCR